MYEKTLVSPNSPFDLGIMTEAQIRGQSLFNGKAKCVACHTGSLFTDATIGAIGWVDPATGLIGDGVIDFMQMGDGGLAFYDSGFYNAVPN